MKSFNIFNKYWHDVKQSVLDKLSKFAESKYHILNKKLDSLSKPKLVNTPERDTFQFHEPVINLTNHQFTNNELNQIALCYKSHITENNNLEKLIVDSEHIIQTNNIQNKNEIRYHINHEIKKLNNQYKHNNKKPNSIIPVTEVNNIIKKIKNNNLTINKADKGNIVTIEDKNILNQKTLTFLENPLYNKLRSDPTHKFQNEIKNNIKKCKLIINNDNKL